MSVPQSFAAKKTLLVAPGITTSNKTLRSEQRASLLAARILYIYIDIFPSLSFLLQDMNGKTEELALDNEPYGEDENEYEALDQELDQLNSCLDKLESWNDSLHSRMKDLLESMQMSRDQTKEQTNQSEEEKV